MPASVAEAVIESGAMKILALSGSLRRGSYNTALLRAARSLSPTGVEIEVATLQGVPLYDGDVEAASGVPDVVQRLKQAMRQASGVLISTPEYNGSIPGVLKNAIDWMSRPATDIANVFGKHPVGLIGATPGRGGTRMSQTAWLPVFRHLGMVPFFEHSLYVDGAGEKFDASGQLTDPKVRELLERYLTGFAGFVGRSIGRGDQPELGRRPSGAFSRLAVDRAPRGLARLAPCATLPGRVGVPPSRDDRGR